MTATVVTVTEICCYVSLLIYVILLIVVVYNNIAKPLRFIEIWSLISITILSAASGSHLWYLETKDEFTKVYIGNVLPALCWALGTNCVYFLFIKRLQITFDDTKYAISNKVFIAFYCGSILFMVVFIASDVCYYLYIRNVLSEIQDAHIVVIAVICEQIIDLLLSICLMALFLQRLRRLNVDIIINASHGYKVSDSEVIFNEDQMKIIKSMSKVTILSCFAIVTFQVVAIYTGFAFWFGKPSTESNEIRYMLGILDCIVNSLCVVLSFDFAEIWYYRLCCCFDICCAKLCTYQTKRQLDEHRHRLLSEPYNL